MHSMNLTASRQSPGEGSAHQVIYLRDSPTVIGGGLNITVISKCPCCIMGSGDAFIVKVAHPQGARLLPQSLVKTSEAAADILTASYGVPKCQNPGDGCLDRRLDFSAGCPACWYLPCSLVSANQYLQDTAMLWDLRAKIICSCCRAIGSLLAWTMHKARQAQLERHMVTHSPLIFQQHPQQLPAMQQLLFLLQGSQFFESVAAVVHGASAVESQRVSVGCPQPIGPAEWLHRMTVPSCRSQSA